MKKQTFLRSKDTEQLLQAIIERQKELAELTNDMQNLEAKNPTNVNFDWVSKFKEKFDYIKLSKAV